MVNKGANELKRGRGFKPRWSHRGRMIDLARPPIFPRVGKVSQLVGMDASIFDLACAAMHVEFLMIFGCMIWLRFFKELTMCVEAPLEDKLMGGGSS